MIARIQQSITILLGLSALGWGVWWWPESPWAAIAGVAVVLFGHAIFLAAEFILLRWVGQRGTDLRPRWVELVRAWAGETLAAVKVFCWRQPFRSNEVPDNFRPAAGMRGRRGIVFIHGFVCNRGFWTPWLQLLRAQGRAFCAVNLEPPFGSIDDYAAGIDQAVRKVRSATGMPPVLVCHSMGGLAARAWLTQARSEGAVAHVITIGSPHGGTWLGRFSHLENGRQMCLASEWLAALRQREPPEYTGFTCWYSNCDNIVFPVQTAALPGADNRLVRGVAHVALAFHPEVVAASLAKIDAM